MRATPLVLLHGFTGAPASYDATLRHLRTYHRDRVVAPSLVGHGPRWTRPTVDPNVGTCFEAEVEALFRTLVAAGLSAQVPATLVGYSLGARLALGLLLSHPDHFGRAVLIGVNPGLATVEARNARRAEDFARAERLEREGLDAFLVDWQSLPLFETQLALPGSVLQAQAESRRMHTAAGLAYSLRRAGLAEMPDYTPRLASLTSPVHLVVGELDHKFRQLADHMYPLLPRAELAVIPGVGHNVPLEAPSALAALLDALPEDDQP